MQVIKLVLLNWISLLTLPTLALGKEVPCFSIIAPVRIEIVDHIIPNPDNVFHLRLSPTGSLLDINGYFLSAQEIMHIVHSRGSREKMIISISMPEQKRTSLSTIILAITQLSLAADAKEIAVIRLQLSHSPTD